MNRAWLQIFRPPNLLTVPGDPMAGALLTGAVIDWRAALASVLLYAAGLVSNDLFDAAEDARERPDRPIPSGRVSRPAACAVAIALAIAGMALAYLAQRPLIGVLLLLTILLYNAIAKRSAILGPIAMGLCRGLSLLLGAAGLPWFAFATLVLYIAAVTGIARYETTHRKVGPSRWLPALVLLAGFALILRTPLALIPAAIALYLAWSGGRALGNERTPVPAVIGLWISVLLPMQAAFCATGNLIAGAALLACWPVFRVLSRWFYAS